MNYSHLLFGLLVATACSKPKAEKQQNLGVFLPEETQGFSLASNNSIDARYQTINETIIVWQEDLQPELFEKLVVKLRETFVAAEKLGGIGYNAKQLGISLSQNQEDQTKLSQIIEGRQAAAKREVMGPSQLAASQWFEQKLKERPESERTKDITEIRIFCEIKLYEFAIAAATAFPDAYYQRPTPMAICEDYWHGVAGFEDDLLQDEQLCGSPESGQTRNYFACLWHDGVLKTQLFKSLASNQPEDFLALKASLSQPEQFLSTTSFESIKNMMGGTFQLLSGESVSFQSVISLNINDVTFKTKMRFKTLNRILRLPFLSSIASELKIADRGFSQIVPTSLEKLQAGFSPLDKAFVNPFATETIFGSSGIDLALTQPEFNLPPDVNVEGEQELVELRSRGRQLEQELVTTKEAFERFRKEELLKISLARGYAATRPQLSRALLPEVRIYLLKHSEENKLQVIFKSPRLEGNPYAAMLFGCVDMETGESVPCGNPVDASQIVESKVQFQENLRVNYNPATNRLSFQFNLGDKPQAFGFYGYERPKWEWNYEKDRWVSDVFYSDLDVDQYKNLDFHAELYANNYGNFVQMMTGEVFFRRGEENIFKGNLTLIAPRSE